MTTGDSMRVKMEDHAWAWEDFLDPSRPGQWVVDCPDCGQHAVRYAGHHLRSIRDLLVQWIDEYPDLCGKEGGAKLAERLSLTTQGGSDPSVN